MDSRNTPKYTVFRIADDYPERGKPSYGLQPVYYYLSSEQVKLGNKVCVISRRKGNAAPFELIDGVSVHRVKEPFSINAFKLIQREKQKYRNCILHTHSTSGAALALTRRIIDMPIVSHVHGSTISKHTPLNFSYDDVVLKYSKVKTWYYYFRERYLWSSADRVLSVSNLLKRDLEEYYKIPQDLITTVYNGVDTDLFRPITDPAVPDHLHDLEGKRIILYVGHFGPRKGLTFLLNAMRDVVVEVKDAVLLCIGGVPDWLGRTSYWQQLLKAVKINGLEGKVFFINRISNFELPKFYSLASVFVLPSYYESFGKVVVEAMACERPVVATKGGGIEEIIIDRETGFLIDYGSSQQIAQKLVYLLKNPEISNFVGAKARKQILEDFTWKSVAERINDVYRSISPNQS